MSNSVEYHELFDIIPNQEIERIMNQYYCELNFEFMGFTEVYKSVLSYVPKNYTIIDLGCYLAAQSYYFFEYKHYIGVDTIKLNRFQPNNATHYICTIQDFIEKELLKINLDLKTTFAICSYVPDEEAIELAKTTFKNILVYYPAGKINEIIERWNDISIK